MGAEKISSRNGVAAVSIFRWIEVISGELHVCWGSVVCLDANDSSRSIFLCFSGVDMICKLRSNWLTGDNNGEHVVSIYCLFLDVDAVIGLIEVMVQSFVAVPIEIADGGGLFVFVGVHCSDDSGGDFRIAISLATSSFFGVFFFLFDDIFFLFDDFFL